ncbi:MAG: hypothetical protein PHI85_03850 [Victivallaceae bacterium]|nr:hypothetical protein [Victivallaceae bacterium]
MLRLKYPANPAGGHRQTEKTAEYLGDAFVAVIGMSFFVFNDLDGD